MQDSQIQIQVEYTVKFTNINTHKYKCNAQIQFQNSPMLAVRAVSEVREMQIDQNTLVVRFPTGRVYPIITLCFIINI